MDLGTPSKTSSLYVRHHVYRRKVAGGFSSKRSRPSYYSTSRWSRSYHGWGTTTLRAGETGGPITTGAPTFSKSELTSFLKSMERKGTDRDKRGIITPLLPVSLRFDSVSFRRHDVTGNHVRTRPFYVFILYIPFFDTPRGSSFPFYLT